MQYIELNKIPQHIQDAVRTIDHFFEAQYIRYWELSSIADRRLVNKLEHERDEARIETAKWRDKWRGDGSPTAYDSVFSWENA